MARPKNNRNSIHAQRLRAIRPFVSFNIDLRRNLSDYQKRKIKAYYDEFNALTARPFHTYKSKNKERLLKAKEYAGQDVKLTQFKAALIPSSGQEKVRVKFTRDNKIKVSTKYVTTSMLEFNESKLGSDPVGHVAEVLAGDDSTSYSIIAGKYEIPHVYSKERIGQEVARLVSSSKYSNPDSNHYYGNWLFGVRGHKFKNQSDVFSYMRDKEKAKEKLARERKLARQRARRRKGK